MSLPKHDADCWACNRDTMLPVVAVAAYCDEGDHPVQSLAFLHARDGRELCVEHLSGSAPEETEAT